MNKTILYPAQGGVTAPLGFTASGVCAGIKDDKKDLAVIYSAVPAQVGAVFTTNKFPAAPVAWCRSVAERGGAQAIVANSGCANACTGLVGEIDCSEVASWTAEALRLKPHDVLVASTGVIGQRLPMAKISDGIDKAVSLLSRDGGRAAAEAIMTTDTVPKLDAVYYEYEGRRITVGGIAKGSGMIHPNMATLLCFITTDAAISGDALRKATKLAADESFNMITVDGDTSTNDSMIVLANGLAENEIIELDTPAFTAFLIALKAVAVSLARKMARDGEGATKLLEIHVTGAKTVADARRAARSVVGSNLVKCAFFGKDANWGRIICALGYSGADFNPEEVSLQLSSTAGRIELMTDGAGLTFDEAEALKILQEDEIIIELQVGCGDYSAIAWGCDFSYEYVRINGDYRS